MPVDLYLRLGIALGIGLLVGAQRERVGKAPGGIRTFALISIFGSFSALLADEFGQWLLAASFLALTSLVLMANWLETKKEPVRGAGITSEIAAILVFAISAYLMHGEKQLAVVAAGVTALLLHYKDPMHAFVGKLSKMDLQAIMQFVLISLVILPVLPNETYDPYEVLNPFKIWLMVVLIVGIGLFGYVAFKLFSAKAGTLLGGVLGGMISSTATTISAARDTKDSPTRATAAALIIMIATAISIVRVLIEVFAVANPFFLTIVAPFSVLLGVFLILTFILYRKKSEEIVSTNDPGNPAQLKPAIIFGLLYALILFVVAFTREKFGESGLYVVAVLSGLTDVDAITLSTAQMMNKDNIDVGTGWRLIMVATLANTLFKGGAVALLGGRALLKRIVVLYGIAILSGVAIIFLWP
ncbi:MgtC/SapB family protein [Luteolibacter sp. AS25]|uniref:MgtC/SapB family protein n=1 Tax=Luteolibacter sp. AS25 TaxID=3135776 RepID=UPI00398AC7B0